MSIEIDAGSRLVSIRDLLEHEGQALSRLTDRRLLDVLVTIEDLKLELSRAIYALEPEGDLTSLEAGDGAVTARYASRQGPEWLRPAKSEPPVGALGTP